jgi:hypothetical protein
MLKSEIARLAHLRRFLALIEGEPAERFYGSLRVR